jgi:hypothetical protein
VARIPRFYRVSGAGVLCGFIKIEVSQTNVWIMGCSGISTFLKTLFLKDTRTFAISATPKCFEHVVCVSAFQPFVLHADFARVCKDLKY